MNWLAHFVLSEHNRNLIIGNWLGEAVRGKDYQTYEAEIQKGILLHREIDSFTDSNPIVKKITKKFHHHQGKFAPVVVDLVMDYFLYKNWQMFENEAFEPFKYGVYKTLKSALNLYPEELQNQTKALITFDWMEKYTTLPGVQEVLNEMSKRTDYPNNMDTAIGDVYENEEMFNNYFLEFFPQLQSHCKDFLKYYDIGKTN